MRTARCSLAPSATQARFSRSPPDTTYSSVPGGKTQRGWGSGWNGTTLRSAGATRVPGGDPPDMIPGPNWARRYGSHHRRLCARPGCGAVAAATLRFQPTQREAWLVELDDSSPRTEGDLCARHAAALVL